MNIFEATKAAEANGVKAIKRLANDSPDKSEYWYVLAFEDKYSHLCVGDLLHQDWEPCESKKKYLYKKESKTSKEITYTIFEHYTVVDTVRATDGYWNICDLEDLKKDLCLNDLTWKELWPDPSKEAQERMVKHHLYLNGWNDAVDYIVLKFPHMKDEILGDEK